jgi:hypothetical protein
VLFRFGQFFVHGLFANVKWFYNPGLVAVEGASSRPVRRIVAERGLLAAAFCATVAA